MTARTAPGEIVTFYSYKGGTGRSMLLANVAWILACNGRRVLVLDWDLEAPGVHRYFLPFMVDKDLTGADGIIDFVIDFSVAALSPTDGATSSAEEPWFAPYANVVRYASSLEWEFPEGGTIDFVGAGRQGASYSTRVNSFDWQGFYERYGGGALLEEMKRQVKERYDYILVDSRTGVSDTSGICTLQLPDTLVVCFTLNNQSIDGAAAVTESVHEQRARRQPIRILPVPMRVEDSEKEKLEVRKAYARRRFARFPKAASGFDADTYWADVEVRYVPFYAYEEILATFGDRPGERHSILSSAERLVSHLTDGNVRKAVRPSEGRRLEVLAGYEGLTPPPPVTEAATADRTVYLSYRRDDTSAQTGRLYDTLSERFGEGRIFADIDTISPGLDYVDVIDRAVGSAGVVLAVIGRHWLDARDSAGRRRLDDPNDFVRAELATALRHDARVIPVLVDDAEMPTANDLPPELAPLARRNALVVSSRSWQSDVGRLGSTIEVILAADRRAAPLEAQPQIGSDVAYSDEKLTSLLDADARLQRTRWIALGLAIAVIVSVAVTVLLLFRYY